MSYNSRFHPEILEPKTLEEAAFQSRKHVKLSTRVPDIRKMLGLALKPEDPKSMLMSLERRWRNLRKGVEKISIEFDFYDDSPKNQLEILQEFKKLEEIKWVSGELCSDNKRHPCRIQTEPESLLLWFIDNRRQTINHAHNVSMRNSQKGS
ncbi:hypothetical protein TWF694_005128 [Orbilia ellipsospora]|uniref:Uncharacterized protein n=1 Tax=Orbilia ellipsospora TaxID=2528407 RepID=A0AAV9WVY4_9PEZI